MKRPAFFRFAPNKTLFLFLGVAAFAFAPNIASAQHGGGHAGGGHAGGGMSGGGHFSPPPAPHYSPPPAPHIQPATHFAPPRAAYVPPRVPPVNSVVNNRVVHPTPAPGNVPQTGAGFSGVQPGRAPVTIGFPSAESTPLVQLNSGTTGAAIARPGAPLRFFGEGHQIYSERAGGATVAPSRAGSSALTANAFRGAAGSEAPTTTLPVGPRRFFPPHLRVPPILIGPGFGPFGFGGYGGFGYGFGYGFGSPFYFGGPFFFGDPFFGFQYGSVWQPCDATGIGFQCAPYNSYYGYEQPYTSTRIGGTETETQSQQIFSPYSPAYPPPQENNNAPSPDEYVLYMKDGSVYVVNDYWYSDGKLVYSTSTGQDSVDLDRIDMQKTLDVNAKRGLVFTLRPAPQPEAPPDQNAPAPAPQP